MKGRSRRWALSCELEMSSTLRTRRVSASLMISIMARADLASSRDQALTSYHLSCAIIRRVALLWKSAGLQV